MDLYPVLIRDQWFEHHTYTLRLADNIEVRLTEQQVLSLADQIDRDQSPMSDEDRAKIMDDLEQIRADRRHR